MGEKRGNPKRRIPENIVERVEEEQLPHEAFFHQTLARLLSDAGIDLTEEVCEDVNPQAAGQITFHEVTGQ